MTVLLNLARRGKRAPCGVMPAQNPRCTTRVSPLLGFSVLWLTPTLLRTLGTSTLRLSLLHLRAPGGYGWLENCLCPRCFNESRETDHGKPIPDTEGVTLMTPRGRRNLHRNNKKRKYGSQPPSPVP